MRQEQTDGSPLPAGAHTARFQALAFGRPRAADAFCATLSVSDCGTPFAFG
jgi:hypothetical protein